MQSDASSERSSDGTGILLSLPDEILGEIIRALSFQDKCHLECVNKQLQALLKSPSPREGLWGRCDLMLDLKLDVNILQKVEIMR